MMTYHDIIAHAYGRIVQENEALRAALTPVDPQETQPPQGVCKPTNPIADLMRQLAFEREQFASLHRRYLDLERQLASQGKPEKTSYQIMRDDLIHQFDEDKEQLDMRKRHNTKTV